MSITTHSLFYCGQKIAKVDSDDFYLEILTRRLPNAASAQINISDFFQSLSAEERFAIFDEQNQLADKLFEATGIKSSINLDNEIMKSEGLRQKALESIQHSSAPTTYEFTETYPIPLPELMNPIFELLRSCGKRSALDDFGTGFNGMSLFVDYDFDIVKIDRSLIIDIESKPSKLKVLTLIRQMIDALGKDHVVEGVESHMQLDMLHSCGFHNFQGFLLHKPEPIENFLNISTQPLRSSA